ncbi:hypothetical protein ACH5RR_022958 [Cinchona calisaya]|uniref:Ty3 transposon capsid-like protein domain-containing protein n=1 Tax=Cinchona calisaya TaxID=153742 RepID=A0ABD2ZB53_9GENT
MDNGSRNKRHGSQVDTKIEQLTNSFNDLLGPVKNMSMQLNEISSDMKGLLNNGKQLNQSDTVAEYHETFAELRDLMMTNNYGLTEGYLISSFLSGLKEEIRSSIQKPRPKSLIHALNLARNITKRNEPVTNEDSEIGSVSVQHLDAKIETLTGKFNDLLGIVKNMSKQLEEITSDKKGQLNNGRKIAADSRRTQAVSDLRKTLSKNSTV